MKKALFILSSVALILAGCAKEKLTGVSDSGESVKVTVNAFLQQGNSTRASWDSDGNGDCVNRWIMEVYDAQGILFDRQVKTNQSGLTNKFDVVLIKNQDYKFAFWADTDGAYDASDLRSVKTVSDVAGLDSRDAFFAEVDYRSEKSEVLTAKLYRPFAQINIVTLDLKKIYDQMALASTTGDYDKFIPKNLKLIYVTYHEFNVLTGTVSDPQNTDITIDECYGDYSAHKDKTTIFMDYGFAGEEKEIKTLNFSFTSNDEEIGYAFTNIPLQRNGRTNIYGNLLSNDAEWNVEIRPAWDGEYDEEHWSAGMITPVTPDSEGIYNIEKPSQLAWVAQQVNSGESFAGKTVKLANDIDLSHGSWTPIGNNSHSFQGTFDGNGYEISNLTVALGNSTVDAGLFSWIENGTVKNVKIHGAEISVVGGAAAVVAGRMFNGGTIENVTVNNAMLRGNHYIGGIAGHVYGSVKNCSVEQIDIVATPNPDTSEGFEFNNGDKCGGIVGFCAGDNTGAITGNHAKYVSIAGYRDLGGITGAADCSNSTVVDNSVENSTIVVDQTVNFYEKKTPNAGAVVGRILGGSLDASNVSEDVTIKVISNAVEKALDEAGEGDTVVVESNTGEITIPATLAENVTLQQAENVVVDKIIIPAGADIKGLVIKDFSPALAAIDQYDNKVGFVHLSKDAKVEDLVIDHCNFVGPNSKNRSAIYIEPSATAEPKTFEIKNCTCTAMRYFVYTDGEIPGTTIKLTECEVTNMYSWAVLVNNGNVAGIDVQGCTFSGGDIIKTLQGGLDPDVFTFTFTNNTITGTTANFTLKAKASRTTISGNRKNGEDWNPAITVIPE